MTKIEYEVPDAGNVTIKTVDIIGTPVRVLIKNHDKAGKYSADLKHESLAPGKYYYKVHMNIIDHENNSDRDNSHIASGQFKIEG